MRASGAFGRAAPALPGTRLLSRIGSGARRAAEHAAGIAQLAWRVAAVTLGRQVEPRAVVRQLDVVGVQSLPLVFVTAVLSGVVTSQQGGYQFTGGIPLYVLGNVVASSIILELGPVLTAFVVIGRAGARMTAEIGAMRVSEQLDALESLGRDPVATLAAPRVLASAVALPLLVGVADLTGVLAGMLGARGTLGLAPESFLYGVRLFWHSWDLFYSLAKGAVFGLVIPLLAVYVGLGTVGGAEGVGQATTRAVMAMMLGVLVLDALFPPLLLN